MAVTLNGVFPNSETEDVKQEIIASVDSSSLLLNIALCADDFF
jgi:hypothetical protein